MTRCPECAGALAPGQRYCLVCGARAGAPLPELLGLAPGSEPVAPVGPPATRPPVGAPSARPPFAMPSPALAGAVVAVMIGAGVFAATEASPPANATPASARAPIVIDVPAPAPVPAAPVAPTADAPAVDEPAPAGDAAPVDAAPPADAGAAAPDAAVASAAPVQPPAEPAPPPAASGTGQGDDSSGSSGSGDSGDSGDDTSGETTPEAPPAATVPPIAHVWIVRLAERADQLPSLAALRTQGGWLAGYRPLGDGGLQDVAGLLSGQDACADQAQPCAFGPEVETVLGQLTDTDRTWRAYVEDHLGPAGCAALPPTPGDPFGAFASLADATDCVPLSQLAADLQSAGDAPALSLVLPGLAKIDPASADPWLAATVAELTDSAAYADGGLVVVTLADGALVLSTDVAPGTQVDAASDAFSLLRTLQDAFGLPTLGRSADAAAYDDTLWTAWSQDVHGSETSS
ncbi:hypothetical protein [Capillimicrobium parvum]|uniref:Uncharacterized protein n=1 Tax=Capillimicrobium parvum TaxID=2884022 RepID=A0A9E7BZC9_9ACTN|nr:hypothetical protein [Capillimicrobium parvum]UGS35176.1 hypothetical protein DSM104329_01561 [Capillimicrobium parvum]